MHSAHSHTYYELFYLINGNCTISIDDKLYTLSAGNVIFIPANSIHRTSYIGDTAPERIYIEFSSDYINTIGSVLGNNWAAKNLWEHILYIETENGLISTHCSIRLSMNTTLSTIIRTAA